MLELKPRLAGWLGALTLGWHWHHDRLGSACGYSLGDQNLKGPFWSEQYNSNTVFVSVLPPPPLRPSFSSPFTGAVVLTSWLVCV